jgi:hypothetical protein
MLRAGKAADNVGCGPLLGPASNFDIDLVRRPRFSQRTKEMLVVLPALERPVISPLQKRVFDLVPWQVESLPEDCSTTSHPPRLTSEANMRLTARR